MELRDLIGMGLLDAVDFETVSLPEYDGADTFEDCNCCRFRLNGTVYVVVEDPIDGYRSSMRDIRVDPRAEMKNVFPPALVLGVVRVQRYGDQASVLELIDTATAKTVLEVGTDDTDGYYPSFVASFSPENMGSNRPAGGRN